MKDSVATMITMTGALSAALFVLKHLNEDNLAHFKDGKGKIVWWLVLTHLILALVFSVSGLLLAMHAFDTWTILADFVEYKIVGSLVFALLAREIIPMVLDFTLDLSQYYVDKTAKDLKTKGTMHKDGMACDYTRDGDPVNKDG